MKKRIAILLLILAACLNGNASNNPEISLLTCSLGKQVYATFGHSALRIHNKETGSDQVYNFGMFDFSTPNFQVKFMRGKLQYELGILSFDAFMKSYQSENRLVREQVLNLTDAQKAAIIQQLDFLYLPENRYYYYEFCKKNCTTALRDLIFDAIAIDTSYQQKSIHKTYRMLFNECLYEKPWLKFGINLILGSAVDKDINVYESMFLPQYLWDDLNTVKINGQNLVIKEAALNTRQEAGFNIPNVLSPSTVFFVLLIFLFLGKPVNLEPLIFALIGILGILIVLLGLTTEHQELKNNFNLLWCNPLYLLSAVLLLCKQHCIQKYLSYFYLLLIACSCIIGLQAIDTSFTSLILILVGYNIQSIVGRTRFEKYLKWPQSSTIK